MKALRIIFMGTPEFAVPSLKILVENNFNVVAVITAPDKPQGRGQKIAYSPIKEFALQHKLLVLQPTNLKSPEFIETLKSYKADLQIVVAFRMLPEVVWSMPPLGTFNLHASLLPQYRGAAPINWAIINGETETGVTTFLLQHAIDTGNILFQEKEPIYDYDTVGTLYERLMYKGAQLVLKTTQAIANKNYKPIPQHESNELKHAPKIFKETCEIDWSKSSREIHNFVRGLNPHPGAWTTIQNKIFKVFEITPVDNSSAADEQVRTDQKTFLHHKTADGWVDLTVFQPEGKKKMTAAEFFRGNKL